jgi:hypothetical protein
VNLCSAAPFLQKLLSIFSPLQKSFLNPFTFLKLNNSSQKLHKSTLQLLERKKRKKKAEKPKTFRRLDGFITA